MHQWFIELSWTLNCGIKYVNIYHGIEKINIFRLLIQMFLHFLMCPIRALWPWCLCFPDCSSLTKKALRGVKVNVGSLHFPFWCFFAPWCHNFKWKSLNMSLFTAIMRLDWKQINKLQVKINDCTNELIGWQHYVTVIIKMFKCYT